MSHFTSVASNRSPVLLLIVLALAGGTFACTGAASSGLPKGCSGLGTTVSMTLGAYEVEDAPSPRSLVPDTVEFVSLDEMPTLVGGRGALQADIEYPESAREREIQGIVHVGFILDEEGEPQNLTILRSVDPALDRAAVDAVSRQHFEPGRRDGTPICTPMAIGIHFRPW